MYRCLAVKRVLSWWLILLPFSAATGQEEAALKAPATPESLDNLVQGRLYSPNYFPIKGNPFLTKNWDLGDVRLLGNDYVDMPVWYDIYIDELILLSQQTSGLRFIRLNKEHVESFSLADRRFINLAYSRYQGLDLKKGYYEVAFEDKVSLLIKRGMEVQSEDKTLAEYFERNDQWYLVKSGQVFRLRKRKNLIEAIGQSRKKELNTFLKVQKIRFKKAGDAEWLQVVEFVNALQAVEI